MIVDIESPCMRKLTVVVPTLNEEDSIDGCLDSIGNDERVHVVVSDGGSRDATLQKAHTRGATVVSGTAGRGGQLNRGAAATDSELLLFLHSDCRLPRGWYLTAVTARRASSAVFT